MKKSQKKIRYAVVGQGYISQIAVLPAFAHAKKNSELVALVSGDPKKLKALGRKYQVKRLVGYEGYDELLESGEIDAVFIALPNDQHRDYAERAARAGIHVLCEKPMAVSSEDCESMITEARESGVKLMIAYRLHFEEANLKAIELIKQGKIGEPRLFSSIFTIPVKERGIRVSPREKGGGPVYDIGIYCINAARYLFQDEPIEVHAVEARSGKRPFTEIEEAMSVTLRFPKEKLACFVCGFDCMSTQTLRVAGTKGDLLLDNAYEYVGEKVLKLTVKDKPKEMKFRARDQFAPELLYFSDCILRNKEPEPSGLEGLADLRIIEAIFESAREGKPVKLEPVEKRRKPGLRQEIRRPKVEKPRLVRTDEPTGQEAA